ncbi:MAG TPA: 30S ribosomal protein S4 [Gemmatimonadales bacterium]|jgi:small subunit ribosomal protein S4
MARYTGPVCRLCRREGTKLFLKGSRCLTEKCAIERRAYPPGQHGQQAGRGRKMSEYAKQLREKQKVKRMYGLTESQFRNTYSGASRLPGMKGTNLLVALETRLDNIVYRMGFASSRRGARQLVRHGHVEVNGRKVDIPSFRVVPGQEVRVTPADREQLSVKLSQEHASRGAPVSWLSIDTEKAAGRLVELPTRDGIPVNAQEQLIVELYSK